MSESLNFSDKLAISLAVVSVVGFGIFFIYFYNKRINTCPIGTAHTWGGLNPSCSFLENAVKIEDTIVLYIAPTQEDDTKYGGSCGCSPNHNSPDCHQDINCGSNFGQQLLQRELSDSPTANLIVGNAGMSCPDQSYVPGTASATVPGSTPSSLFGEETPSYSEPASQPAASPPVSPPSPPTPLRPNACPYAFTLKPPCYDAACKSSGKSYALSNNTGFVLAYTTEKDSNGVYGSRVVQLNADDCKGALQVTHSSSSETVSFPVSFVFYSQYGSSVGDPILYGNQYVLKVNYCDTQGADASCLSSCITNSCYVSIDIQGDTQIAKITDSIASATLFKISRQSDYKENYSNLNCSCNKTPWVPTHTPVSPPPEPASPPPEPAVSPSEPASPPPEPAVSPPPQPTAS